MKKESPVKKVAEKPSSTTTTRKRKTTGASSATPRHRSGPKQKRKKERKSAPSNIAKTASSHHFPDWVYYLLMGVTAVCFITGFYYFFIRPYAYRWKPCYGAKAYGVCIPYGYPIHGFDLSHHQGTVNWNELEKTQYSPYPIQFVFMKASEGGDFSDTTFKTNFSKAREYGFIRGAYHFYNPNSDPIRQADFFINSVQLTAGDLPPVLDIEKKGNNIDQLKNDLKIWLDKIESHYRVKPILYTSYKFKTKYLNDSIFNTYPYWIAHYYVDSVRYEGQWKFWQHTDVGLLPGINKRVDLNVFNGTMEELKQLTIPATKDKSTSKQVSINN